MKLLNLVAACTTGYQLSHRSAKSLRGQILYLFEFKSHNDGKVWFRVFAVTVDLMLTRLTKNQGCGPTFRN